MALHNQLGALGEEVAAHYLSQLEYRLLERNWRTGHLEVDIIAEYYGEIVFVEVKTRSYEAEYTALEAVDRAKKKHLVRAAHDYMHLHHLDAACRFDIITVVGREAPFQITHYIDAYSPQSIKRKQQCNWSF